MLSTLEKWLLIEVMVVVVMTRTMCLEEDVVLMTMLFECVGGNEDSAAAVRAYEWIVGLLVVLECI